MPNVGSWNGRWSGEGKDYLLWRNLTPEQMKHVTGSNSHWCYSWGDGWGARISARVMERGERRAKSAGFCGYGWMVDNIVKHGHPRCECEWVPDVQYTKDGETWVRCVHCKLSRQVVATPRETTDEWNAEPSGDFENRPGKIATFAEDQNFDMESSLSYFTTDEATAQLTSQPVPATLLAHPTAQGKEGRPTTSEQPGEDRS